MITLANAQRLVVEANAVFDTIIAEGCFSALAHAQQRVEGGVFSLQELALCVISECRNPSPLQDIPDFRHLTKNAPDETVGGLKRYLVAVFQHLTKNPPEFDSYTKIAYCAWHPNS